MADGVWVRPDGTREMVAIKYLREVKMESIKGDESAKKKRNDIVSQLPPSGALRCSQCATEDQARSYHLAKRKPPEYPAIVRVPLWG